MAWERNECRLMRLVWEEVKVSIILVIYAVSSGKVVAT